MRLLVALDGSPSSLQARDLVAGIPWPHGTVITLLTASTVPITFVTPGMLVDAFLETTEDALREQAETSLAELAAPLADRGWTVEQRVVSGRAADVILATAEETQADLIVLGSRGHGRIRSMLLGSVSAEIADHAAQSVLVARHDHISRLLVATDGSESASAIPDVLGAWGVLQGIPATALSVAPTDSPAFHLLVSAYALGDPSIEAQRKALESAYGEAATAMRQRLGSAGIPSDVETRHGDPAHEIVEAATAHGADLVVTGSRSLHGTDRFLLGSVARGVLMHTAASVLIVRAGGASRRAVGDLPATRPTEGAATED